MRMINRVLYNNYEVEVGGTLEIVEVNTYMSPYPDSVETFLSRPWM